MSKGLRFKAPIPSLVSGGKRWLSTVVSNFPYADVCENPKRESYAGDVNGNKSTEQTFHLRRLERASTLDSLKKSLSAARHEVVKNMKTSPPISVGNDDDFAELGQPLPSQTNSNDILAQQKHEDIEPSGLSIQNDCIQSMGKSHQPHLSGIAGKLRFSLNQENCSQDIHFHQEDHDTVTKNNRKAEKLLNCSSEDFSSDASSMSVSFNQVPSNISLLNLRKAISAYGKIMSASMRTGHDGCTSYHVTFESIEAKERALAAKWIMVGNYRLPVCSLNAPEYIIIRISNISTETTEPSIYSMCMSCGSLAGLSRTKEGAAEVVFKVRDKVVTKGIVDCLSKISADGCRWSAELLPDSAQNSTINAASSRQIGSQINYLFGGFRKQFNMQRIYLEDLEDLHHAILHLRNRPDTPNSAS
ncbi:hypothetical protein J5N97_008863 [Dioscorea zingiberensis]|uniref:RRM domain-containing protein n=1 Tax=Dioscorea zingiberensis TaxID=325984 RepID=A0A9D5CWH8_9LILI|nr:hypothetical protein J5N97_008863 [Dioscorea zingiberensis]